MKNPNGISVPLRILRKAIKKMEGYSGDTPISFEFLMTLCFPSMFDSIQQYARDTYTQGFIEGRAQGIEEATKPKDS